MSAKRPSVSSDGQKKKKKKQVNNISPNPQHLPIDAAAAFLSALSSSGSSGVGGGGGLVGNFAGEYESAYNPEFQNVLLEGLENQERTDVEAKEEPPSEASVLASMKDFEKEPVEVLAKLGFSRQKCLEELRKSNHNLEYAKSGMMQQLRDLQEARIMDQIRTESEHTAVKDKDRAEEEKRIHLAYADVIRDGTFSTSIFLDSKVGVQFFKNVLSTSSDGFVDLSFSDIRDECIRLLTMEQQSCCWYGLGASSFLYEIACRLAKVKPLTCEAVKAEADGLEKILFQMPEKAGDMPPEFQRALKNMPISKLRTKCSTAYVAKAKDDVFASSSEVQAISDPTPMKNCKKTSVVVDLT